MAPKPGQMAQVIRVNGQTEPFMVLEHFFIQMDKFLKEISEMVWPMVKEPSYIKMAQLILAHGKMTFKVEKVLKSSKMSPTPANS